MHGSFGLSEHNKGQSGKIENKKTQENEKTWTPTQLSRKDIGRN